MGHLLDLLDPSAHTSKLIQAAGIDLGNGTCAQVTIAATRTTTTPTPSGTSAQILAANPRRIAESVTNNGSTAMSLGFGVAAVAGVGITVAPGGTWSWKGQVVDPLLNAIVTPAQLQGALNAIWAGSPTGTASVTETDA